MDLLTATEQRQLQQNHREQNHENTTDYRPVVKIFTPDANATWLFTEFNSNRLEFFGLCDLGQGEPELGYVSAVELGALRGKMGLHVEKDRHFKASKTLSEYAAQAREERRIIA